MIKNRQILKRLATVLFVFILCVIFIEPLRTKMNNIFMFMLRDRGSLKEEEVIGTVAGYNPRVKEIQGTLKKSGFYSAAVDGFMGSQTRKAIKDFQKAKGLQVTGSINQVTFLALNRQSEAIRSAVVPPQVSVPAVKKEEAAKTILPGHDSNIEQPDAPSTEGVETFERIKQVQSALKGSKFYTGKIDGIMGLKTKRAVKAFQRSKGLKADGIIGPKTEKELNKLID